MTVFYMLSHKICNEGEKIKDSKILLKKTLKYRVNIQTNSILSFTSKCRTT